MERQVHHEMNTSDSRTGKVEGRSGISRGRQGKEMERKGMGIGVAFGVWCQGKPFLERPLHGSPERNQDRQEGCGTQRWPDQVTGTSSL